MVMFKAKSRPLTGKPAASNSKWQAQNNNSRSPRPSPGRTNARRRRSRRSGDRSTC